MSLGVVMDVKLPSGWRGAEAKDVGTLWSMHYAGHRARCALLSSAQEGWEVRVLVDGFPVLSERCARGDAAFRLASDWQAKMTAVGWRRVPAMRLVAPPPASPLPSMDGARPCRVLAPRFAD